MTAKENGNPATCILNLLKLTRGECPYERLKGIDPNLIDKPSQAAVPLIKIDARWLIKTYEPRVELGTVDINTAMQDSGRLDLGISYERRKA